MRLFVFVIWAFDIRILTEGGFLSATKYVKKKGRPAGVEEIAMRPMRGKKKPKQEESAKWLLTFNDLVTCLMVFFVLVFSLSSIDLLKIKDFLRSFQSGLGVLDAGQRLGIKIVQPHYVEERGELDGTHPTEGERGGQDGEDEAEAKAPEPIQELTIEDLNRIAGITAVQEEGRTRILLEDRLLFASGRADVLPASKSAFEQIVGVIRDVPHEIRVEGHTDNVPISTEAFPSNWELSVARAVNVTKYLIEKEGILPERLCAVGYGETRPLFPNDTPEHRQKNRRVELVMTHSGD